MRGVQAYIGIRANDNSFETSDVTTAKTQLYAKHYSALVHGKIRVPDTRWVSFMYSYPNFIPLPASTVQRIAAAVELVKSGIGE